MISQTQNSFIQLYLINRLLSPYDKEFTWAHKDSEKAYRKVYGAIVKKYGYEYGGTLIYYVLGRPEKVGAEIIISYYNLPLRIDEFLEMYRNLQIEFRNLNMMPGAEKLLRHSKEHNIPIALATILGGSDPDVKLGKRNPDIFLVAAKRFPDCPDPFKCLVFEDVPNGVQATVSAGMQTVMVPDRKLPKKKKKLTQKPTIVLNSLEDFKPEQFGLPKFDVKISE
ncbi:hypothetical protein TKK_0000005 [Trichogramma kaykai]